MVNIFAEAVIRFKWLVILLCVLSIMSMGYGARYLQFTNDYRAFFGDDNPQLMAFDNLQDTYSKNDNVMMVLVPEGGDV